jgi:hypothetical protein
MKNPQEAVYVAGVLLSLITSAHAAVVFSDNFAYPNGNLVGQGEWVETGGAGVNPIQVNSERVALAGSGQDAGHALSIASTPTTSFYIGVDLNLAAAKDAGDYFLHVTSGSAFSDRICAKKSDASTFLLGIWPGSTTSPMYGAVPLNNGQDYHLVIAHDFGSASDKLSLFVDPTGSGDIPYVTGSRDKLGAISAINLRQGADSSAPFLVLDNLTVSDTFLQAVPEPSTYLAGAIAVWLLTFSVARTLPRCLPRGSPHAHAQSFLGGIP